MKGEGENFMENKTFLRIPNKFFTMDKDTGITIFHQIGTQGFTIWSYLLMTQGSQPVAQTSIKRIRTFFYRNKGTKKKQAKNGLSDARTIKKYLNALVKVNMIECEQLENENLRADDELFIKVNICLEDGEYHSQISTEFFTDKVHIYGHIGWSIYCILFKNHNESFGNQMAGNYGFANCSEDHIGDIIDVKRQAISEYIQLFNKGDVKVEQQPCVTYYNAKTGKNEQKYMPNHYIVWAKADTDNKYYVEKYKN